jgi:hypothetical protein
MNNNAYGWEVHPSYAPVGYLLTNKFSVVFIMIFHCVNGLYGCCVFLFS